MGFLCNLNVSLLYVHIACFNYIGPGALIFKLTLASNVSAHDNMWVIKYKKRIVQ